ncbi:MAG TPA: alpha/beta hydrolase [bacterium]|nr:MAG: hypothetical protein A2Z83_08020 [Omnitrophica bacterium GWA2_52_8]HLD50029.1 alpha/beta hydrolase [bacterium]
MQGELLGGFFSRNDCNGKGFFRYNDRMKSGCKIFCLKRFVLFWMAAGMVVSPLAGMAAEETRVQVSGAELNYIEAGEGRPVVMIHGNHSSLYVYSSTIFDAVSQKYRAVAIDLPGYGKSKRAKSKMTFDEQAAALHEAFARLKIEKPVMVGHSMGAAIVLRYILNYPGEVHAAVLTAPYTTPFQRIRKIYRVAKIPVLGDLFIGTCVKPIQFFRSSGAWTKAGFSPEPVDMGYTQKEVRLALQRGNFKNAARNMFALRDALREMNGRYGEIKVPVIILAGDSDLIAPPEEQARPLHEKIPGSRLIILPRAGHLPMFTRRDEILKAIDEAGR